MRRGLRHSILLLAFGTAACGGCGESWSNLTASFGGSTAGQRGSFGVLFINNTPYRAVCTHGSYDQTDPLSQPDFDQFDLNDRGPVLEGNSASDILPFRCARVFSIGGPRLLALIHANLPDTDFSSEADIEGVEFFSADPNDPDSAPVSQGKAAPFEALLGADFPCNALLIFRLEVNDSGPEPFRVDFELIPSESSR
ncbi:MAG: hypothetical protein Q7R41_11870 [Phycisphaerales bacterium]|nr:hypothetical protein [Phycisphaerales bacterium]